MNSHKELTHLKSKVQWWAFFAFLSIVFAFTACDKNNNSREQFPSLKVVNQSNDHQPITSVVFVGYEFKNLNIASGDSQTFVLDGGMQGGYKDIYIVVRYGSGSWYSTNTKVNFNKGETTTITLKGCISYDGCQGCYLE